MRADPATNVVPMEYPPMEGPGSSRYNWIVFAYQIGALNTGLLDALEEQSAAIRERDAEIELLRQQIASRKPNGGRPRLPPERVSTIEAELAAGAGSQRAIATRNGVSAMTVNRAAARMKAREALGEASRSRSTPVAR